MKFAISLSLVAIVSAAPAPQRSPLVCAEICEYRTSRLPGVEACYCPGTNFAGVCPAECNLAVIGDRPGPRQVWCRCGGQSYL